VSVGPAHDEQQLIEQAVLQGSKTFHVRKAEGCTPDVCCFAAARAARQYIQEHGGTSLQAGRVASTVVRKCGGAIKQAVEAAAEAATAVVLESGGDGNNADIAAVHAASMAIARTQMEEEFVMKDVAGIHVQASASSDGDTAHCEFTSGVVQMQAHEHHPLHNPHSPHSMRSPVSPNYHRNVQNAQSHPTHHQRVHDYTWSWRKCGSFAVVKRPPSRFTASDRDRVLGSIMVGVNHSRVCPLPFDTTMRVLSKAVHTRNQPEPVDDLHGSASPAPKPVLLHLRPVPTKEGALLVVSLASVAPDETRLVKQVRHIRLVNCVLHCYSDANHQQLVTKFELAGNTSLLLNPPLQTNERQEQQQSDSNTILPFSFEIEWRDAHHTPQLASKGVQTVSRSRLLMQSESRSEMVSWAAALKYSIMVLQGHKQVVDLEQERALTYSSSDDEDSASDDGDPNRDPASVSSKVEAFGVKSKDLLAARKLKNLRPTTVRFTEQMMPARAPSLTPRATPTSAMILTEESRTEESAESQIPMNFRAGVTPRASSRAQHDRVVMRKMQEFNRRALAASSPGEAGRSQRSGLLLHTQVGLAAELQALIHELLRGQSVSHLRSHRRAVRPLAEMIATTNAQNHRLLQDLHAIGSAKEGDREPYHAEHQSRGDNEVQYGHLVYMLQRAPQVVVALGEVVSRAEQQEYAHFLVHTLFNRFSADVADLLQVLDVCITRCKGHSQARVAFFTFFLRAIALRSDVQTFLQLLMQQWLASPDQPQDLSQQNDRRRGNPPPNIPRCSHGRQQDGTMARAWDLARILLRSIPNNSRELDGADELHDQFPAKIRSSNSKQDSLLPPVVIVGVMHLLKARNCTVVTPMDFLLGMLLIPALKTIDSSKYECREAVIARGVELRFPQPTMRSKHMQRAWTDAHAVLRKACRPEEWAGLKMVEQAEYAELKLAIEDYAGKLLWIGERHSASLTVRTKPWCLRKLLVVSLRDMENLCASLRRHLSDVGAIAGHLPPGLLSTLKGLRLSSAQTSWTRLVGLNVKSPSGASDGAATQPTHANNRAALSSFGGDHFMAMHRSHAMQRDDAAPQDNSELELTLATENEIWSVLEHAQRATQPRTPFSIKFARTELSSRYVAVHFVRLNSHQPFCSGRMLPRFSRACALCRHIFDSLCSNGLKLWRQRQVWWRIIRQSCR
jgi:hypothetical protein